MRMDAESIEMMNKELQTRGKSKIVIPDNATNGDVIKAMFPNTKAWVGASSDTTCVEIEGIMQIYLVPTDWWNAPYKENKDV